MMKQGGQGSESRRPSSPRGGSSAGSNNNMAKFSLLGQPLTNYGSVQQQQHHQNHSHSSNPNSGGMNFSLGAQSHAQQQAFSQGHQQQQPNNNNGQQPNNNNGGGDGTGFSNMQNVNSMVGGAGQGFNQNHFMDQQMLQQTSDFLKINRQQASQAVPAVCMPPPAGVSQESLLNALSTIQQKIVQLQAMVPFMGQNQQMTSSTVQQQAAAAISQIAVVAANMFPGPQQQQQQQNNVSSTAQSVNPGAQQQQQLSQLFGSSVAPAFNFFQPSGSAPMNNNNGGGSGLENNFPPLEGGSGVAADSTGNNMAIQIVDGGAPGNSSNASGLGVAHKPATPSGGGHSFGGPQGGVNNGSSLTTNMNSALVVRNQHCSPHNNQMGSGITRGGPVSATAVDIPHINSNRSVNSAGVTAPPKDDHDVGGIGSRDEEDDGDMDAEHLLPGSYDLVEMEAIEILAEHTHFCEICGKGFKRDANLRMHMRGHGDEYKTPAALARPDKATHEMTTVRPRRFSCPYVGCKRNKRHRKFQPLKTMLCVKNHYRRSHCPKVLTCTKCKTKKFSVVADLKTHEKHCGCDKWQCSCGTTFSRKDKLFGHIGLFAGHTPATPFNDVDCSGGLEMSEMGAGPGNTSSMPSSGNNTSSYGLSGGGNMNSGVASSMGLGGGGSGMGLGGNDLQGLSSRAGAQGGSVLNVPKDGNVLTSENSSSSDSFPSPGNLMPGSAMLQSLFTTNFLQSSNGGNPSPDGLH